MANFDLFFPKLMKHEGGFVNHPSDPGGATNKGITFNVFRQHGKDYNNDGKIDVEDLKRLTSNDAKAIYKKLYWDAIRADQINSQSIAELLFDFAVNSGVRRAAQLVQHLVNVKADGAIGPVTIAAINSANQAQLNNNLIKWRLWYYQFIANFSDSTDTSRFPYGRVPQNAREFFANVLRVRENNSLQVFINGWLNRINSFEKKK
jgi:lysozyme family protein